MVSYYYFVRLGEQLTPESVIYRVKVGSGQRDQSMRVLIEEFSKSVGHYFHKVSVTSDNAIRIMESKFVPGSLRVMGFLRRDTVSISELYRLIIDDSFAKHEQELTDKQGSFYFKSKILPFIFPAKFPQKKRPKPACPSRKYLKSEVGAPIDSFLIGSFLVVVIFLFAGWLEGNFGY